MTSPDNGRETRVVPLRDRSIVVRQLTDAQLLLMAREARLLQREELPIERKINSIDRIFSILESSIVQEDDREFAEDLMASGELDLRELMGFISVFKDEEEAKPKVRRGRPPRVKA